MRKPTVYSRQYFRDNYSGKDVAEMLSLVDKTFISVYNYLGVKYRKQLRGSIKMGMWVYMYWESRMPFAFIMVRKRTAWNWTHKYKNSPRMGWEQAYKKLQEYAQDGRIKIEEE